MKYGEIPELNSLDSMEGLNQISEECRNENDAITQTEKIKEAMKNTRFVYTLENLSDNVGLLGEDIPFMINAYYEVSTLIKEGFGQFEIDRVNLLKILVVAAHDYISKFKNTIENNLEYDDSNSFDHIIYKIIGIDIESFDGDAKSLMISIGKITAKYYEILGNYSYASEFYEFIGDIENAKKMTDLSTESFKDENYDGTPKFSVHEIKGKGRKMIKESGILNEIQELEYIFKDGSFKDVNLDKLKSEIKSSLKQRLTTILEIVGEMKMLM